MGGQSWGWGALASSGLFLGGQSWGAEGTLRVSRTVFLVGGPGGGLSVTRTVFLRGCDALFGPTALGSEARSLKHCLLQSLKSWVGETVVDLKSGGHQERVRAPQTSHSRWAGGDEILP